MRACLSARLRLARAARRRRRAPPSATPTPTCTSPASLLCSRSGDDTFITTGKPIAFGGLHRGRRPTCTARRRLVLMPYACEQLLRAPLGERLAGRQSVEQLAGLLRRGRAVSVGAVGERRAVARRERPVVDVGLHRGDAVGERAERRQAAVEQPLVVRVVGAGGRAPDHEDRLVGRLRRPRSRRG